MSRISLDLAPVKHLVTRRVDAGPTSIVWSAAANAPIDVDVGIAHAAIVWGDALLSGNKGRARAERVAQSWSADETPAAYDGYYAAAATYEDGRVMVGSDILGLFPVYYTAIDDVLLVGASPEPFRSHPAFRAAASLEGLLTILMFGGPVGGACLLDNVRRLGPRRVLAWRAHHSPQEILQYELPTEQQHARLSFDDQVDVMHEAFRRMTRRHHPLGEPQGLLLSGGRDSRLLAGYLNEQGNAVEPLTLGVPTDHDVECAERVTTSLRWPHRVAEVSFDDYPAYAAHCAKWEHLGGGMATMHTWGAVEPCRSLPARSANGYNRGREQPLLAADLLQALTARAIHPDLLRSLVRSREAHDIIDGLVARFEAPCDSSLDRAELAWRTYQDSYGRFYTGAPAWRLSFGSWPVMATLDRDFVADWVGIPISVMANRALVDALFMRWFPQLAALPFDENALAVRSLSPSMVARAHEWFFKPRPSARRAAVQPTVERRRYYRHYSFDNPGWIAVRTAAEPFRHLLGQWFDLSVVDRMLPTPESRGTFPNPMTQGFNAKLLLGVVLWAREHFGSVT